MLTLSPQRSRIVLVGTPECKEDPDRLNKIPSISVNLRHLKKYFAGLSFAPICISGLVRPDTVIRKIALACDEAVDALLIYYCGHALRAHNGCANPDELYLSVLGTNCDTRAETAMPYSRIASAVAASKARKKLLILDCCHAEQAFMNHKKFTQHIATEGIYVLGAAQRFEPALAPRDDEPTMFTGELLKILYRGPASARKTDSDEFTIRDVADELRTTFALLKKKNKNVPRPVATGVDEGDTFVIGRIQRGFDHDVQQELVAESIGVNSQTIPKKVRQNLEVIAVFRAKQLAYELTQIVKTSLAEIDRFRKRLEQIHSTDTVWSVIPHELSGLTTNRDVLVRRLDECHRWTEYVTLTSPIHRELDEFTIRCLMIARGRVPREDISSVPTEPGDFQPVDMEFADMAGHWLKEISRVRPLFRPWRIESEKLYQAYCRELGK